MNTCEQLGKVVHGFTHHTASGFLTGATVALVAHSNVFICGSIGAISFLAGAALNRFAMTVRDCGKGSQHGAEDPMMKKVQVTLFWGVQLTTVISTVALGVLNFEGGLVTGALLFLIWSDQVSENSRLAAINKVFSEDSSRIQHARKSFRRAP